MKMLKAEKHEWIANLLSGAYKQGTGVLNNTKDNTFCCLGVLCDTVKERTNLTITQDGNGDTCYNDDMHGLCKALRDRFHAEDAAGFRVPVEMLTSEELKDQNVVHSKGVAGIWISDLNDTGMPFSRIAQLIDACVEAV